MGIKGIINPSPKPLREVSVTDLITKANAAMSSMGQNNPNRALIHNLASALKQMTDRLAEYEDPKRII